MMTLYELAISHYNEKVRWALDLKGIEHRRVTLIPGFHRITMRRHGSTTTPVLKVPGRAAAIVESAEILEYLDEVAPTPPLFPADPEQRAELDELVRFFDTVTGRSVRAYLYWMVVRQPGSLYARWAEGLNLRQRMTLRPVMPLLTPMVVRAFGLTEERAPKHLAGIWRSCDRIEARLQETGGEYLVGGAFSAADLTAVALLGPAAGLTGSPWDPATANPPPSAELQAFREEFAARPAAAWAHGVWNAHRHPATAGSADA
jgi:glutathione S-transferase